MKNEVENHVDVHNSVSQLLIQKSPSSAAILQIKNTSGFMNSVLEDTHLTNGRQTSPSSEDLGNLFR